jgi:hypothetical protein
MDSLVPPLKPEEIGLIPEKVTNEMVHRVCRQIKEKPELLGPQMNNEVIARESKKIMAQAGSPAAKRMLRIAQEEGVRRKDARRVAQCMKAAPPVTQRKVVYITASRQIKSKSVPVASLTETIRKVTMTDEFSPLSHTLYGGKVVDAYYCPTIKSKNRLASQILGKDVGGDVLLVWSQGDLLLEEVNH